MIRGSDGLDYEDLAERLVGEPAKTGRNRILGGPYSQEFKGAYRETYDYHEERGRTRLDCHRAAFAQACDSTGAANGFADVTRYAADYISDPSIFF